MMRKINKKRLYQFRTLAEIALHLRMSNSVGRLNKKTREELDDLIDLIEILYSEYRKEEVDGK